jgi:hypothetical protein
VGGKVVPAAGVELALTPTSPRWWAIAARRDRSRRAARERPDTAALRCS